MTVTMEVLSALRLFAIHLWSSEIENILEPPRLGTDVYSYLSIEQSTRYFEGLTHCADPGLGLWCPSMFASLDFSA